MPVRPETPQPPRLTVEGGIERAPCALEGQDVSFQINAVTFEDLQGLAPDALRPAYEQYIGTTQPVSVICEIRDRAATILRDAGYIAAVEVPEQRIADGNVRFQVLMAKLVGVRVRGNAGNAEQTIAAYLNRLTEQPVFNRYQAERYLLLAGDLPGYDVRLSLRSAEGARGEVIGEVAVIRQPGQIDFNVQNYGSKDLGRFGALLRGQFYGLTGLGDRTTVALFSTLDFDEQQTLQLGHDFRVGGEGLTVSGQFTYSWADPDLGLPNIDVKARTLLATLETSYPFVRTQSANVRGAVGLDLVNQRVRFNAFPLSQDKLRVAYLKVDMDAVDRPSLDRFGGFSGAEPRWRLAGNVQLRQGLDIFDATDRCFTIAGCTARGQISPSRLGADPTGLVYRAEAFGEYRPVPNITFALNVRAQYSGDPLLSFEEYSVGNYTVGRGYDPGTLLGDRGAGFQAELRFGSIVPQAMDAFSFQPYVFMDAAWVRNNDLVQPYGPGRRNATSIGGGVRALYGDKGQFDVLIAVPLERAGLQIDKPDPRILLSFTTKLWPWSY
ncbi:Hemolysin activation/secretion protein [Allosphingosinicella indica]|uniref:Hemolysin activation/secretion protein n=1 Tax=Allosphingosinicella indica TaxID=941907 RepID=A0A1X7G155_9SPHN|nr:Hemolysin activation/secretion protein [Allosphingosinicella indica]